MSSERSLRDLTLRYSAAYLALVVLTAITGAGAVALWRQASEESLRVTGMVQDVEAMRGNLYRQMKELFDTTFLDDPEAQNQYNYYSELIDEGLRHLAERAKGAEEQSAVRELKRTYHEIHLRTDAIVSGPIPPEGRVLQRIFDTDLEAGGLKAYEAAFRQVDQLFLLQQQGLQHRLERLGNAVPALLAIPMIAACALLVLTRRFLAQAVLGPFSRLQAGARILAVGNLDHRLPREGAREIAELSQTINSMAEELQQSRAALLRAERQATLGALVPVVAHNIRNPLASIRATAQVLDDDTLSSELRDGLHGIMKSTDRLERWTASLLSYLHPLEAHLVQADPGAMLDELLDLVEPQFQARSVQLERLPHLPLPATLFDPELIEQALYGLIMNALEATPRQGKVEVGVCCRDSRLEVSICDQGPGLQWTTNGAGIPREPMVPGRTTKRTGTGLGIPFALKVSEVHDGGLRYLARPGGGTEALFWIPNR